MKTFMKSLAGVGVFLAVFAVSTWATTNTIQIFNFDFGTAPSTHVDPTINVGDTVEWVWASGSTGHSTTTAAGQSESWDSGVHTQPNTFTHTFANAGTFNYYCTQHGANPSGSNVIGMSGHVVVQAPSTNQDVKNFIAAAKGQMFEQLTAGAPTLMTTGFAFHADVRGIESNSIFASSVQVPAGAIVILTRDDPNSSQLEFNDQFTTKTTLDNTYHSSATYTQTIDGLNQGTLLAALTLPADAYPTTPQIVNFTAAQSINSATNFVLTWNAFSGGTASDFISLAIDDNFGAPITNTPDLFAPGVLNGSATSVTIPGGTLAAGTTYQGRLLFVKVSTTDSNSIAGAIGGAGFFKETSFSLATVAPPGVVCALSPALATNDVGTLHTVTATITSNGTALAGVDVNFDVIAGPNTGTNGFAVTDIGGHAGFSYAGAAPGTDTIQASGAAFNCTAAKVWLGPNVPPVAVCQNVVVAANASCQANVSAAQVDNNSSDPDGSIVSRTLSPSGPYALGATPVTLTVTDNRGATNSCSATITVLDQTPPVINCPANIATNVPFGVTSAVVNFVLTASDNCSLAVSNSTPASGSSFALGTTTVTNLAIDAAGNTNSCNFNVTVTQVAAQADLALSGSSSVATASLNSTFSYSFIVTNKGPQAAVNIEFLDGLTAGVSYISSTSSVGNVFFDGVHLRCHLGTLEGGSSATISLVVSAITAGVVCDLPPLPVHSDTLDPNTNNNWSSPCTTVVINDLAVTAFKAPKKVSLSTTKPSVTSKLSITVQNRSDHVETIPDLATLSNLVTIALTPLGENVCPAPVVTLVTPKKLPPYVVLPGKSVKLAYTVNFTCATDALATSKTDNHNDYQYLVTTHHEVLDGLPDSDPADDACPHDALGVDPLNSKIMDKGCGVKQPDGSLGPVVTDIIDTRL